MTKEEIRLEVLKAVFATRHQYLDEADLLREIETFSQWVMTGDVRPVNQEVDLTAWDADIAQQNGRS